MSPCSPNGPGTTDADNSVHSSLREKILEHAFLGDLLRILWRRGVRDIDILRAEVDQAGYDLALECNGILRHIQLKSSFRRSKTSEQKIHVRLAAKPSGCVVWIVFDPDTMELGPFLWFGGAPGAKLPDLGDRVARHTKANSQGEKAERKDLRVITKRKFIELRTKDELVETLFGKL